MSPVPAPDPAPGHDGEQPPLPGDGAREGAAPDATADGTVPSGGAVPSGGGDDGERDAAADLARMLDDIDAGLIPVPPEDEPAPPVMFSLGETAEVDPAELAAMAGPDGLAGQGFARDGTADAMRPGPLLSVLAEQAAGDPAGLSDDELLGMVSAARRLQNRAVYLELAGIAEFARRRAAQYAASVAGGARPGRRDGEFPDDELGMELVMSRRAAGDRMELADGLATRLPCTFAGLAAGVIDGDRARIIWSCTRFLSDADAAYADRVLAAAAPGLKHESLAAKAYRLELKLDPEGVRRRKDEARQRSRRMETRRELSGNMSFGGRELSAEEALSVTAFNDGDAAGLRAAGLAGSLRELRVLAFLDRLRGRDPFARIPVPRGDHNGTTAGHHPAAGAGPRPGADGGRGANPGDEDYRWYGEGDDDGEDDGDCGPGGGPGGPGDTPDAPGSPPEPAVPLPALINLIVPAGNLFGWSDAAAEAGRWGLLDPADTRAIVHAASLHPRTRWCVTVVTETDGTAIAHGCARGQHPWTPPGRDGPARPRGATGPPGPPAPDAHQQAQLAELLRALNVTLTPIAKGTCDHRHREDRYTPSRALRHLVSARTARCIAPGCTAPASSCDLDHTIAYPHGPTDECNLGPPCRHHHNVKQAPGWHLDQPEPGVMRWTAPSGRTYTTTPTVYDT